MIDPEIWYHLVFWIISGILVFAALFTVEAREVMHSVFGLATTFICIGILFILLGAEYLAIIQILVYVGAVAVLMAFAIMLTRRRIIHESEAQVESDRLEELEAEKALFRKDDDEEGGEEE